MTGPFERYGVKDKPFREYGPLVNPGQIKPELPLKKVNPGPYVGPKGPIQLEPTIEAIMDKDPVCKDTNPKDAVGVKKAPISTVSGPVLAELGVAMLEGARKYGRHNYRIAGVRASVYMDAVFRHMEQWWEGEDVDKDSGLSHITKAIASLCVLRDAMIFDNWVDDRPPPVPEGFWNEINKKAAAVIKRYPDAVAPYTHEHKRENNET